jgi:hypothetical protein
MRFDHLGERLLEAGIAPKRVRRYLRELSDHLEDLTEQQKALGLSQEEAAKRARDLLGSEAELAEGWLCDPRFKSLPARAPWLVFAVLPPLAAILALVPPALLLVALAGNGGLMQRARPQWFETFADLVVHAGNLTLVPLIAFVFAVIARRQRLSPLWPGLAAALLLLLSVHMHYQAGTTGHRGELAVGMSPFFFPQAWALSAAEWPWTAAQWLLTLLPAISFGLLQWPRWKED